jgi:hypothetical protein
LTDEVAVAEVAQEPAVVVEPKKEDEKSESKPAEDAPHGHNH